MFNNYVDHEKIMFHRMSSLIHNIILTIVAEIIIRQIPLFIRTYISPVHTYHKLQTIHTIKSVDMYTLLLVSKHYQVMPVQYSHIIY